MNNEAVILKSGREKPVRQRHPWIFSGAIRRLPASCADGDIVEVTDHKEQWLARGYLNRASQIQVRLLTWDPDEAIDEAFWRRRLAAAIDLRRPLASAGDIDAYRLIYAENDYLPGLIVDRYRDVLVLQAGTLAIDRRKHELAALLLEMVGCRAILERSDTAARRLEGLEEAQGSLFGDAPTQMEIQEGHLRFTVDLAQGQKTGFYLDQRPNRLQLAPLCAGARVLNCFAYTGAFAVHALAAGADHVVNIDTSLEALELAETNLRLNGFDPDTQTTNLVGDVFEILREWRAAPPEGGLFDVAILDPPKFAQNKSQVDRALRGYKDINLLALHLLKPDGLLASFSCSGLVSADLFQKVIFGAAVDAGRDAQIIGRFHQGSDHPVALTFPEGDYLKGLLCHVS